jgi:hypothetical protein
VEVHALHLGGEQEPLRLPAEKQHGSVRWHSAFEQVEMGERLLQRGILRERKLPFAALAHPEDLEEKNRLIPLTQVILRGSLGSVPKPIDPAIVWGFRPHSSPLDLRRCTK